VLNNKNSSFIIGQKLMSYIMNNNDNKQPVDINNFYNNFSNLYSIYKPEIEIEEKKTSKEIQNLKKINNK
jgi:hypothetical protein